LRETARDARAQIPFAPACALSLKWRQRLAAGENRKHFLFRCADPGRQSSAGGRGHRIPVRAAAAGQAAGNGEIRGRARVVRLVEPSASSQWFCGIAIEQCDLKPGQSNWLDAF